MSKEEKKEKNIFRTGTDEPKKTITPSGTKIEDVWELKINDDGREEFYISGQTNVYEKIQSQLEKTKIENILAMCLDTGDMSALNQVKANYMDLTEMPDNMIEAHNTIIKAQNDFMKLPVEVKEKFENNFNKYLKEVGTEPWLKAMGYLKEEPTEEKTEEKEVKEDE